MYNGALNTNRTKEHTMNTLHTAATPFDDMPSDLDFDHAAQPTVLDEATASQRYATAPSAAAFRDPCKRCGGTGKFRGYSGRVFGSCFACKGLGYTEHKTSAAHRAQAAAVREDRKVLAAQDHLAAFATSDPARWAWIEQHAAGYDFAASLRESVSKYGTLTDGQAAAVDRGIARDADREAARAAARTADAERAAAAPAVDASRLHAAFATAQASGLKWPKIKLGEIVVKPAGASSRNPGALYVTLGGEYMGKIVGGKFIASRECPAEVAEQVVALVGDPQGTAEAHGLRTGHCCICSRELTDPVSVARGIGPVCGARFGW